MELNALLDMERRVDIVTGHVLQGLLLEAVAAMKLLILVMESCAILVIKNVLIMTDMTALKRVMNFVYGALDPRVRLN